MSKLVLLTALILVSGCAKRSGNAGLQSGHDYQALTYNSDFINATERVTPVQPANPLAAALVDCAYRLRAEVSCRPDELPLIGQQFKPVTIDAIMSRTLVSHASFGDTFRRVLESLPPEALKLFGAVTVVVVSDKINPSFVTTYSGGMYLSGRYFWRTRDEKRLVEQASDPRNSLPNRFRFDYDRQYTINGRPESFRRFRNSRTTDELAPALARLLFHELAHANDAFPAEVYRADGFGAGKTYAEIAEKRWAESEFHSQRLHKGFSLERLFRIGATMFNNASPLAEDQLISPEAFVREFSGSPISDLYGLSNYRESFAMLSEEALMLHYLGAQRTLVVYSYPTPNFVRPEDYPDPIVWGQRNRVVADTVRPNALEAVRLQLGEEVRNGVAESFNARTLVTIPENTSWSDAFVTLDFEDEVSSF